jgi:hypothetical protein
MKHRLCATCINQIADAADDLGRRQLISQLATGNLEVCLFPHNCDHRDDPDHTRPQRFILDELPANARD